MLLNNYIVIELEFFGVLKNYVETSLFFQISCGTTIEQLKKIVLFFFQKKNVVIDSNLFNCSVFSSYTEVLCVDFSLKESQKLFLLPPVSGG